MRNKKRISLSLKISLLVMIMSLFGIGTLTYISFGMSKEIFAEHTAQMLAKNIDQYGDMIKENIAKLKYNLNIFSYNPSVKGFMRSYVSKYKYDEQTNKTFLQYKKDIQTLITLMMRQNPSYFQMRIIDGKNGDEILKLIRKKDNIISVVQGKDLQNKWMKQYTQDSLKLDSESIYISKINLNKEFNTIEFPLKPTIRVAKVIMVQNAKAGIVVINANIKKLFGFEQLKKIKDTQTFIANEDGDYLFDYNDPNKTFGFEFGKEYKIFDDFPQLRSFYSSDKNKISIIDKANGHILEARKIFIAPKRYIVVVKTTSTQTFNDKKNLFTKELLGYILSITLLITLATTVLVKILMRPIKKLTEVANEIAQSKGEKQIAIRIRTNDEIEELSHSFEVMIDTLEESKKDLKHLALNLEKEVEKKTKELQLINKNLQKIVNEKVTEVREKDKALVQQSKLAAMGEMIGAIAHQWRQPLNSLAINLQMLEDIAEDGKCDEAFLEEFIEKNMQTIKFMSQTIDDFRNFFRTDKQAERFNTKEMIEKTINLQRAQLQNHNITIHTDLEDGYVKGFKNEFMQVILNLISNAKDVLVEKMEQESSFKGEIYVQNKVKDGKVIIKVADNGGGIPQEIQERIFEPYFTTKEEGKGTGMGLYMVKGIIDKMDGEIEAYNQNDGAVFVIRLKEDNED